MNDAQILEQLAATDAYAPQTPLPAAAWTRDAVLAEVERRSDMPTQKEHTRQAPLSRKWRGRLVAAAAFVLVLIVGVAMLTWTSGGGDTTPMGVQPTSPSTTLPPEPTTLPPPEATTTWTGPVNYYEEEDELGLRVPVDAPEQSRAEFLAELDAEGWATYIDEVVGWSIRYPADWTLEAEPGRRLILETPTPGFGLEITLALDAAPEDTSSYDYHVGYIRGAVAAGELYPPLDDEVVDDYWTPYDVNFNGRFDPQDITFTDLYRAVDDEGNPMPDGHPLAWFWSWAYYDPAAEPAYGYLFEDFGYDRFGETGMYPAIRRIVLSFEPLDGYQ